MEGSRTLTPGEWARLLPWGGAWLLVRSLVIDAGGTRSTSVPPSPRRVVGVLEYLPQDLVGQVSYEYYHPEDIQKMVQLHHDGEGGGAVGGGDG